MGKNSLLLIVFVSLFEAPAPAQFITPETVNWQTIRNKTPAGLSLKLNLPKTRFHQGELIEATLTYSNTSAAPYHLWVGTYDRSGRIPDIAFYATDAQGNFAPDPLRWHFERGGMGGGLGNESDLGEWKITLPANQWIFPDPGTYKLFAYSNRVQQGDRSTKEADGNGRVELVSDPVTITIDPISREEEQRIVSNAREDLAIEGEASDKAITTLRYLGTPSARASLLPLVNGPHSFQAAMAFYAAPDSGGEAVAVLDAVRGGKVKLGQPVIQLYATLKTRGIPFRTDPLPTEAEMETFRQKYQTEWKNAADEITSAAIAASGGKGPEYYETLITTLFGDPEKRPKVRAELVDVQLSLTREQADAILRSWRSFGGEDFLPLVRKLVGAPAYSPAALKALATLRPEEARSLIIEDIQRESPRYLIPKAVPNIANAPLLSLPDEPIPELDSFFRDQLANNKRRNLDLVLSGIERYGTASLLPDVIKFYMPSAGKWACDIQSTMLRFWLRHQPESGIEALQQALSLRGDTRCYTRVLSDVLLDQWNKKALPLVSTALDDPDPDVVMSAVKVLEKHADADSLPACIAALQRLAETSKPRSRGSEAARNGAQLLLQSKRWQLSAEQRRQLDRIGSTTGR